MHFLKIYRYLAVKMCFNIKYSAKVIMGNANTESGWMDERTWLKIHFKKISSDWRNSILSVGQNHLEILFNIKNVFTLFVNLHVCTSPPVVIGYLKIKVCPHCNIQYQVLKCSLYNK